MLSPSFFPFCLSLLPLLPPFRFCLFSFPCRVPHVLPLPSPSHPRSHLCLLTQYFPPPPLYHIGMSTAFADGTSNLSNELKPKPQVCLAASLFPNLCDTTLPPARLPCPSSHHDEHQRSPRPLPRGGPLTRGGGHSSDNTDNTQAPPPCRGPPAWRAYDAADPAQELFLSPPLSARASSDPTNTPTVTTVALTGNSIELLVCGNTSTPWSRRCTRSLR
jgi:hypothetical protein